MMTELTTRDRERFERFVDRSGGPDACHPWTGQLDRWGYGRFKVGERPELAHRVAWRIAGHEITPEKPNVLHNCPEGDLPACCNERHLWDGTVADNNHDMARKGRGPKSKRGLPFGVYIERSGRFGSQVCSNYKMFRLGTYDTAEEASAVAMARKMATLSEPERSELLEEGDHG